MLLVLPQWEVWVQVIDKQATGRPSLRLRGQGASSLAGDLHN